MSAAERLKCPEVITKGSRRHNGVTGGLCDPFGLFASFGSLPRVARRVTCVTQQPRDPELFMFDPRMDGAVSNFTFRSSSAKPSNDAMSLGARPPQFPL